MELTQGEYNKLLNIAQNICKTSYSEDYENCIRHYVRDGKIIRLNHICGITANYAAGGCDGSGRNLETERTHKEELESIRQKGELFFLVQG